MKIPGIIKVTLAVILFAIYTTTVTAQNSYVKLCLKAVDLEKQGKFEAAAAAYSDAISMKPEEWTGYNYRAKVYMATGKYEAALSDISRAISLSPNTLALYSTRAACYEATGNYDRALEDYNMALSKTGPADSETAQTYFRRGRTRFNKGQYSEAVADLTRALEIADKAKASIPDIYYYRGQSYMKINMYAQAASDFGAFLAQKPDNIQAMILQGQAFLRTGEKEKASELAKKIIQLDPSKEFYYSGSSMTGIFDTDARREAAVKLVGEAKTMISEATSSPSRTLAGIKYTDAFHYIDSAWLTTPGLTAEDRALIDTITALFFRVYPRLRNKPEIPELVRKYSVQASAATKEKNYDEAIRLWSTALRIAPYYPIAYYNRALLHEIKGSYRYSIDDMEKYIRLMPDAEDARGARDKIYSWEPKVKDTPVAAPAYQGGAINRIESSSYSPGNFRFAMAVGGSFGVQWAKNESLGNLWAQATGGATPDHTYSDDLPFMYSGDLELIVKPIKRIGIGAIGKMTGGIGTRTSVSGTKYMMDMTSFQYGGFLRYYFVINNAAEKPDFYAQYGFGLSSLAGYYGVATMDGIIYNYSFMNQFKGSSVFHTAGVGIGGKLNGKGYLTISLEYLYSVFDKIDFEITTSTANPSIVGTKGTLIDSSTGENTSAVINGVALKIILGFCL